MKFVKFSVIISLVATCALTLTGPVSAIDTSEVILLDDAAFTDQPRVASLPESGDSGELLASAGILTASLVYLGSTIAAKRRAKA